MPTFAIVRVVLGVLIAPLVAVPALPLLWCAVDSGPVLACAATTGGAVLLLLWVVVLFGYPAVFVVGGPQLFILRRRGSPRPLPIALAGAGLVFWAIGVFRNRALAVRREAA